MPLLPSLPQPAHLADLLANHPDNWQPLMAFHDGLLRKDSALTIGQKELIAAYVSALNACKFCTDSHLIYARAFAIDDVDLAAMVEDLESSPVDDAMKPLLAYVAKLNRLPSRLVRADVDAVMAAGWREEALVEAIQVCALFNMMNRIVEGAGIDFDYDRDPQRHPVNRGDTPIESHRYSDFGSAATKAGQ